MPSTSGLKMQAVYSSETLVPIYKSTWSNNPDDQHRHLHCYNSLNSHVVPAADVAVTLAYAMSVCHHSSQTTNVFYKGT
jgi:hypothetical protein